MAVLIRGAFHRIQNEATKIELATFAAWAILKSIEHVLIGHRFEPTKLGNLKGIYQITDVSLSDDCQVCARGRKVLANNKLGSQSWDLGIIHPGRLGL